MSPARNPQFRYEAVWRIVERIPRGAVATYGQVARLAGLHRQARFIGYALHNLPPGLPVPWHRVINSRGMISFPEGSASYEQQRTLLEKEGIHVVNGRIDLARYQWKQKRR